jgi:diguanylate cyclase (GGDEF)-like protein/PAS domain S-box-containing protein
MIEKEFLVKNIPLFINQVDKNGKFAIWNKYSETILGYTAEEAVGKLSPLDIHETKEDCDEVVRIATEKGIYDKETCWVRKDGTHVCVRLVVVPSGRDAQGDITGFYGYAEDITERKRTEQLIREERDKAQTYLNIAGTIIVAIGENQKVTLINKMGCDTLGYSCEEIIGKNWFDNFIPERVRNSVRNGFMELLSGNSKMMEYFENPVLTKSREEKVIVWHNSVLSDDKGKIIATLSSGEDITKRKLSEKAIEISEANYRSIFESANDAIIVRDINTYKVIDVNNRACELFCYRKEEMLGLDLQTVIPGDQPHALNNIWNCYDKAARGEPQLFEQLVKDKIGRTFWVEVSLRRAIIGDKYQLLAITRDITERKDSESKILELNKALSRANENLKHLALRDSHTGLYNHHYFVDVIEAELERAKRHSEKLSIIMMDIDYFKSINDVYGHQFGDTILKQFARLLKKEVRLYDIIVRFGGEEFIIISPGTGKQDAFTLAMRILDTISTHGFGDKKHNVKIKVSAAVISYPSDEGIDSGSDFVDKADSVLNKAKEDGGNRVYCAAELETGKDSAKPMEEPSVDVLKQKLKKLTARGNQSVVEAIFAFAKTIELKDHYTGEHVEKTIHYATNIAESLRLPKHEIEIIKEASILHDLGKIGVPEKILLKTGKLTNHEREVIKGHPQIGADILRPIHSLRDIIPIVLHHHEWWNGKGYPSRIKKETIPIGARIVAIADVYQALTSDRPYHKAYPKEEALNIIKNGSGTQFDPKIVDAFLGILEKEE